MSLRNWISGIPGHKNKPGEPVPETLNQKAWVQQPDGTWINARGQLYQKKDITKETSASEAQIDVEVKPVKDNESPAQKELPEIKKKYDALKNNFSEVSKSLEKEIGIKSTIEKELKTQKEINKELQSELRKRIDVLNNNFTEVSKSLEKEIGIKSTIEKELKTQKEINEELQSELRKRIDVLNKNFTEVSKSLEKEIGIKSTIEKELKTQKEINKELQSELRKRDGIVKEHENSIQKLRLELEDLNNRFEKAKQKNVELEMLILELNKEFGLINIMSKMDGEIKNP